ncbi:MAG: hypothetical protein QOI34_304, partial [Verrucomicrobiota bacterium]
RMFGHNCFGDLHFHVSNGGLDIGYDWWESGFAVDAKIINGGVRAFIPGDASFHLMAHSRNGHVTNDFGELRDRQRGGAKTIDTVVGGNSGTRLHIRAVNGNIKIAEANL